jgi:hypothetical protein
VVAALVVDDPQAAGLLVVTGVQHTVVRDVGEGHGSGDEDDRQARQGEDGKYPSAGAPLGPSHPTNGAVSKGHARSFAYSPSPPPVAPDKLDASTLKIA